MTRRPLRANPCYDDDDHPFAQAFVISSGPWTEQHVRRQRAPCPGPALAGPKAPWVAISRRSSAGAVLALVPSVSPIPSYPFAFDDAALLKGTGWCSQYPYCWSVSPSPLAPAVDGLVLAAVPNAATSYPTPPGKPPIISSA